MFPETNVKSSRFISRTNESPVVDLGDVSGMVSLDINEASNFKLTLTGSVRLSIPDESIFKELSFEIDNRNFNIAFPSNFKVDTPSVKSFGTTFFKFIRKNGEWIQTFYRTSDNLSHSCYTRNNPFNNLLTECSSLGNTKSLLPTNTLVTSGSGNFCYFCQSCFCIALGIPCVVSVSSTINPLAFQNTATGFPISHLAPLCNTAPSYPPNSYNNTYISTPASLVSSFSNCICPQGPSQQTCIKLSHIIAKRTITGSYIPHGLDGTLSTCGQTVLLNSGWCQYEGINDAGDLFVSVVCRGSGASTPCHEDSKCLFMMSPRNICTECVCGTGSRAVVLGDNVSEAFVMPSPLCGQIIYSATLASGMLPQCSSWSYGAKITYWPTECSFIFASLTNPATQLISNTGVSNPASVILKNVCPTSFPACYAFTACSFANAYLIPTMGKEYYLGYTGRGRGNANNNCCTTFCFAVFRDLSFNNPFCAACLVNCLNINTGANCCCCCSHSGFGGIAMTCDGCYVITARVRQHEGDSIAGNTPCNCWFKSTCVMIFCRCSDSSSFCTTPTCFVGFFCSDLNSCGWLSYTGLHLSANCYTNKPAHGIVFQRYIFGGPCRFYLCNTGTCWVIDSQCTGCYSNTEVPQLTSSPETGIVKDNIGSFIAPCLLRSRSVMNACSGISFGCASVEGGMMPPGDQCYNWWTHVNGFCGAQTSTYSEIQPRIVYDGNQSLVSIAQFKHRTPIYGTENCK